MTRRHFVQSLSAAFGIAALRARPEATRSTGSNDDPWVAARRIVESGTLGPVIWGQVSAPGDAVGDGRELRLVLNAMGAKGEPRRVVRLGSVPRSAGATTIVEFESGPPVYVAPGPALEATIRGTSARLHIRGGQLRLVPCNA